jgi:Na+/H+-dicarboxylate symporter
MNMWFQIALWKRILGAMILGVLLGAVWGEGVVAIAWIGELFIRLIRMVVVPLVFVTLVSGLISMGDPSKLGSLGVRTLALYLVTTLIAISIGLSLAAIMQPGIGVDLSAVAPTSVQEAIPLSERLMGIVPENPIAAMAEGNILAIIFFALLLGISLLTIGDLGKPVADFMGAGAEAMLRITHWIMEAAPFGAFALIAQLSGTAGVGALLDVLTLALAVAVGFLAHMLFMHGFIIMKLMLRLSPKNFFLGARDAMLMAFSTSSSSATLPISMSCAEENLGIKPVVSSTVLPLGATINMDGTALYVGIVTVFGAQAFNIDLSLADYLLVAGSTTIVSIGTAAVPGASLFLMAAVMDTIGMTPEQNAAVVGFILAFDRPLDMLRTVMNVGGDLSVSTAVANWEDEFDRKVFDRPRD